MDYFFHTSVIKLCFRSSVFRVLDLVFSEFITELFLFRFKSLINPRMSKYATKIFRLDASHIERQSPQFFIESLIGNHNSKPENNQYSKVDCKVTGEVFKQILYVHKAEPSRPSWKGMLLEITGNAKEVNELHSRYPSFVLFFYTNNDVFAISGGSGYRILESTLDSQFGFNVVERLIDTSKDDIRGLSQRVFLGVELASNRYFKADYVFNDEDSFGKYYRGLEVFIDKKKLAEIGVKTKKSKLLVRGELGFKIDTKISFKELIERIEKISHLLNTTSPNIELNPFKRLTRWELKRDYGKSGKLIDILNKKLADDYFRSFQRKEVKDIYHPNLFAYLSCSTIKIQLGKEEKDIDTDQAVTPRLILGHLNVDIDNLYFPRFLDLVQNVRIWILDEERGQKLHESRLFDWFYGEVSFQNKKYMKFENEWFDYSVRFSNDLDNRIRAFMDTVDIKEMKPWTTDYTSEGGYNASYRTDNQFIVGDGRFHDRIEVSDLISWTDDELIIYHVKDGLGRDLRVLQSQIINAAKVIQQFQSNVNSSEVSAYYSKLLDQSKKLDYPIPSLEAFKRLLSRKNVRFVFGFSTFRKSKTREEILDEIIESDSAVAKISILHAFYTIRQLEFRFSLAKINRDKPLKQVG
jgi:uncharacterized protein (TIGR04141 family)